MSCCTTACAPCSRNSAVTRISWPLLRGIHSYWNAVWLLGRMEGKQTSAVLDLVCRDASATGWTLLQRMFTTAYATGTVLGDADSRHPASFRVLALGFLGMDGRRGRICISLCSSFPNAVAGNTVRRVPRAAVARPEMNAPRQLSNVWGVSVRVRRGGYAVAEVTRRTANDSMTLEMPLKIKLMPTKVPITQTELDGQRRQIKNPRIKVIMPSNKTQPAFAAPRILK